MASKKKAAKRSRTNVAVLRAENVRLQAQQTQLELLLQSLAALYPRDPSGPGVCLAYLPGTREYYGSLLRYDGDRGTNKQVIVCVKEPTLAHVISELADAWVGRSESTIKLIRGLEGVTEDVQKRDGAVHNPHPVRGRAKGLRRNPAA